MNANPPCVILDAPQLAENIGAVARAMANFGLSELRLVRPRDGWPQPRAWPAASGAESVLDEARVFETLPQAIADLRAAAAGLPRRADVFYHLALALNAAHKVGDARQAADHALKLAPNDDATRDLSRRLRR